MQIDQFHREVAAEAIKGDDAKSVAIRAKILAGEADDHPAVQAEAFYDKQGAYNQ